MTSVHVEHMENADGVGESPASLTLDSIVSVTFSEVGLAGAIITTNPGESGGDVSNLASTLTKAVSSEDVMKALMNEGLVTDDTELLTLSFSQFDGTSEERGIFSTETEIVTKRKNDGWPMFFAGVMLSVLLVSIWLVGSWIYQKEQLDKSPSSEKQSSCRSVYYDGDVDLEDATTASGVLGLKGHHPVATQDENAHPNRMNRRKRRGGSSSHKTGATDDSSQCDAFSPMSQRTAASASSKQPLGITSMRKLSTFLTPQKPKSNRVNVYDIERLTYT